MKKKIHALAAIFPELSAAEFDRLKTSIDEHGQRDSIVLLGDEILEGRHRYKACLELGRPPQFRNFDPARDGSPIHFVADKNLNRRHLTPSQRAAVAKKIEDALREAEEQAAKAAEEAAKNPPAEDPPAAPEESRGAQMEDDPANSNPSPSKEEADGDAKPDPDSGSDERPFRKREAAAAKSAGTSPRALRDFKFVQKHDPKSAAAVEKGEISMNEAKKRAQARRDEVSKFRNEAADILAGNLDDNFAEAVRKRDVLRTDADLKAFYRFPVADQRRVRKLVEDGWKPARALKFTKGEFDEKDRIADLVAWFKAQDAEDLDEGWAQVAVAGHVFAISKDDAKTESEEDNSSSK